MTTGSLDHEVDRVTFQSLSSTKYDISIREVFSLVYPYSHVGKTWDIDCYKKLVDLKADVLK